MNIDVAVCLPREAETVSLVRKVVTNALTLFGVTEACIDDIRLALSEACTNVIEHADEADQYEVRLEVNEQRCAISVLNTGNGFDAAALADVMPDVSSPRGRGVAIMRAVMDGVEFRVHPETGTLVHMVTAISVHPESPLGRLQRPSET